MGFKQTAANAKKAFEKSKKKSGGGFKAAKKNAMDSKRDPSKKDSPFAKFQKKEK